MLREMRRPRLFTRVSQIRSCRRFRYCNEFIASCSHPRTANTYIRFTTLFKSDYTNSNKSSAITSQQYSCPVYLAYSTDSPSMILNMVVYTNGQKFLQTTFTYRPEKFGMSVKNTSKSFRHDFVIGLGT